MKFLMFAFVGLFFASCNNLQQSSKAKDATIEVKDGMLTIKFDDVQGPSEGFDAKDYSLKIGDNIKLENPCTEKPCNTVLPAGSSDHSRPMTLKYLVNPEQEKAIGAFMASKAEKSGTFSRLAQTGILSQGGGDTALKLGCADPKEKGCSPIFLDINAFRMSLLDDVPVDPPVDPAP